MAAGRRSAFGFNAALQGALALLLLVGVNLYSFRHYARIDWTRPDETGARKFTLPADLRARLRELTSPTTIVVYQQHKTFSQLTDKPDAYDYAAERKVVEKVKDLVDQFRELGPQFKVAVLDVEEEGYDKNLAELTRDAKELRDAIASAPENSIFFYADHKVQRLSFNAFYQLDKAASRQADGGEGNLVLLYQGEQPFANKVLNIDEKKPKVGILAVHELLTTQGPEDYGLAGLKKALIAHGFDVEDVILKKWGEMGPPEPAVTTYEDTRYDALVEALAGMDTEIKSVEEQVKEVRDTQKLWQKSSLDELNKKYADQLRGRKIDESFRKRQLAALAQGEGILNAVLRQDREEREAAVKEKASLNVDESAEQRRITDLKAKLDHAIADCDLLIVPRMTIRNVIFGDRIPNRFYRLDESQAAAVKDFLKAGKPLLACFGPANESPRDAMQLTQVGPGGPDELERMLNQLGIRFGKETVLFNAEGKSFAERRSGLLFAGANVEIPPVEFDPLPDSARVLAKRDVHAKNANRIRTSMQIASHSRGGKTLDLRIRYPRPIYYDPAKDETPQFEPEFLLTSAASWNEDQPFPTQERTPRFEPPKPDDPSKGTLEEKRRGPFPIGVAIQTQVPADWYSEGKTKPSTVRVAAIGSGGVFVGSELSPAKEELLLDTCNWLLGRDDLLPQNDRPWAYPRVALSARAHTVWHWGTQVMLPLLFLYLGLVVMLNRWLR